MADLADIDLIAPADSLYSGGEKINLMRARLDGLYTILSDITAAEATQVTNMGATTVSAPQWAYLGSLDQSLITTDSPTFAGLTLSGGFTLGGILTLAGNVVCDDYAFTDVGDMTFHNGSILASGATASDTLILKANDTTCITLTTGTTDKVEIAALNALTAIANLDIGAYDLRAATLTADGLTATRVVFAGANGVLSDDADLTFVTDTLSATNVTSSGTITTAALTATANLDIGAYTFTCAGLIDDTLTSGRVVFASTGGLLADDADFTFDTATLTVTNIAAFNLTGKLTAGATEIEGSAFDIDGGNMTGVTVSGDLTWSSAQTGLTLTSPTINGTIATTGLTLPAITLSGAVTGGDQSFTNIGNMTFAAGSILASGATNTNTLLIRANDTTCITLTTAATDQMDLASVYSLVAINNLDIGAYTFRCAGLIDDSLTSGRVIFAGANGLLSDDADMTFSTDTLTVKKIVLNDATTATTDMLTLTPSGAVATDAIWKGIYIDGDALDPSGANAAIEGVYVDLSGVAGATGLEMRGVYASVPAGLGYEALHIIGKIKLDNDESTLAAGETATGIDIIVSASGAGGGEYHAIDVATTGTSAASLTALGTHTGIDVIHQHAGSFISPTQAWTYDDSGTSYAPATTAFGSAGTDVTIFDEDDDAIFVGADAAFDEIEVILATPASVDIKPTFWYSKAATFTQFFPADDTEGFTQDGTIRFDSSDLTDFAAQSVNGTSKFYIKIVRTKNNVVTDPIEDTIKTLATTECFWNSVGAMQVVSIAVPTITTVTTLTASGDLDIGGYDLRALTLTADSLTSGRVPFASTNGLLIDDADFTFATDTLTVTKIGAFQATGAINFDSQNMTNVDIDSGTIDGISALTSSGNLDIGAHTFRAATLIADGLTANRLVCTTTNGELDDNTYVNQQMDNLLKNGSFEDSALPVANTPSGWTLEGTPTVAVETSNIAVGYGTRSAKITATGAGNEGLNQTLTGLKVSTVYTILWHSMATNGDTARLLTTGATANADTDVTATSMTQSIDTFTTDGSGTDVVLKVVAKADTDIVYFDNIIVVEGNLAPAFFSHSNDEHLKAIAYQNATPTNYNYGVLRMECGKVTVTFNGSLYYASTAVTFGTAFSLLFIVSLVIESQSGLTATQDRGFTTRATGQSTTGFTAEGQTGDGTAPDAADTATMSWIAVGVGP